MARDGGNGEFAGAKFGDGLGWQEWQEWQEWQFCRSKNWQPPGMVGMAVLQEQKLATTTEINL